MKEESQSTRPTIFPGERLSEKILNELKDIFWRAEFRPQFLLMAGYSVLMVAGYFIFFATKGSGADWGRAGLAFLFLGAYFGFSDFLKRKKFLNGHIQFWLDAFFYVSLMMNLAYATGGSASPMIFPLLFLTAVSAPLYGSFIEVIIFISFTASLYVVKALVEYPNAFEEIFAESLEATAILVAAVAIKFSLYSYEQKAAEVAQANQRLALLNQDIDQYNEKLELAVKEKTKDLQAAVTKMQASEGELKLQKTAILNILDDMDTERAKTLMEKEKLSRILQSIGDAVFVVDKNRKIIIFNHVAEEVSGYLSGQAVGRRYDQIMRFVDEREHKPTQNVEKVFELGKIQEFTGGTVLISQDGREIPVSDSAAPIIDANGVVVGCIVVFRDVTREREVDRQKTEFVSVASHQLRTPLTSIKWFLEMMIDGDLGKLTAEQLETLKQVFASNERMIDLVNRLLNVSRIESGRVKVEPKPTDFAEIVKSVIAEITPLADKEKHKLEISIGKLPQISIDQKLIREVLVNYMSNAIKYTPPGGKVLLTVKPQGEELVISIKDNGIGIPADQQTKIFHKFFRAENAVARETEGTGMGLYVCKSIVELSGGRTWFESVMDKGTTFYFTLPLAGSQKIEGEKSLI